MEGRDLHVMLEPGRSIVAAAGVLLTKVLYRKKTGEKEFVIVDAAMNDLIRPALYGAYHEILPVRQNAQPPRSGPMWWGRCARPAISWRATARWPT